MSWRGLTLTGKNDYLSLCQLPRKVIFFIAMHRPQLSTFQKIVWIAYLAVALVFIQGVRLHVHTYSHDPLISDHTHQLQAHFEHDTSEKDHPDEVGQIDLSQKGFLKQQTLVSLVIALCAVVIMLLPRRPGSRISWLLNSRKPLVSRPSGLRPPLRAPPL